MKKVLILSLVLVGLAQSTAIAQPYTLDEEIKPFRLELKDDKRREGAKGVAANSTIVSDPQYFYVKGMDMFQFIDVYIFANHDNPDLKVELVKNTWNEVEESASTRSSEKGIINFKLRTYGDFGFKVLPPAEKVNYTVVVYASPPVEEHLGSAFVKKDDAEEAGESKADASGSNSGGDSNGSSNIVLYILIGVALLVIGFLGAKLMNRNKAALIVVLLSFTFSIPANAQDPEGDDSTIELDIDDILAEEEYRDWVEDRIDGAGARVDEALDRLGEVGERIKDDKRYKTVRDLYDSYTGLGDCISSVPPPGMPRVPSFCETDDCSSCFTSARAKFNVNRYTFERLKVIYDCTKKFTDAALSFGDNVSGVHGVSGLAWQSERRKIEKSIKELEQAYDSKYKELLDAQKDALLELANCEEQHGLQDWYDRFGYMYYEFTALHYRRKN